MASNRATAVQTDFALGSTRPDAIERSDTDLQNRGLRTALNTTILSTGALSERDGSFFLASTTGEDGVEIEPANGERFILAIIDNGVAVYDEIGQLLLSFATATWGAGDDVWIDDFGDTILIGSQNSSIKALVYEDEAFSFGDFNFAEGAGSSVRQPYYRFETDITLRPSAVTGTVTLTTSADFFSQDYVGQRIRYLGREVLITSVTSARTATANVKQRLPPTKSITVASATGFLEGQAVENNVLGGQGVITDISGNVITVLVTEFFSGFDSVSGNLVGPDASSEITATSNGTPAATANWDEPLMSPARGYAGSASEHRGRLTLCDFPQAPNVFVASATAAINDFATGTNDDDAIVDVISASRSIRLLHCVSAEDLVMLTSRGSFYQETRDGTPFTPENFDPIKFDEMGASPVRPARVDDGVVFVAKNGSNIYGAVLQGDIYKAWGLVPLSDYHSHLIKTPTKVTATNNDSDRPERFVFVLNSDGTAAIMRWERGPATAQDSVGWVPWETTGSYKAMFMAFGQIHAIVRRTINNEEVTFIERFDPTAQLDAATGFNQGLTVAIEDESGDTIADESGNELIAQDVAATHLAGHECAVFLNDWDLGDHLINSEGSPVDDDGAVLSSVSEGAQVGLPFSMEIEPWARRTVEAYGERRESQRIIRITAGVYETVKFSFNEEPFGGLRGGEDITLPPSRRTEHVHFYPCSRDHYQEMKFTKSRPGPFTLTTLIFQVQL